MLYTQPNHPLKVVAGDIARIGTKRLWPWVLMNIYKQSDRTLQLYKDSHSLFPQEKAIIVCNGPSLLKSDSELLKKLPLVGLNRGALQIPQLSSSFVLNIAGDLLLVDQNLEDYSRLPGKVLLSISRFKYFRSLDNFYFYGTAPDILPYSIPSTLYPSFGNSTALAAQILFFCGVKHVGIVGADHFYGDHRPLKIENLEKVQSAYASQENSLRGQVGQMPDLLRVEMHLRNLAFLYKDHDRTLVNCTEGGKLEVVSRMALEDFLRI